MGRAEKDTLRKGAVAGAGEVPDSPPNPSLQAAARNVVDARNLARDRGQQVQPTRVRLAIALLAQALDQEGDQP